MRQITALGITLLLVSCDPPSQPVDLSQADLGTLAGCPILTDVNSIGITQQSGVDFNFCKYTNKKTGQLLFDVYVGEHPQDPMGLKYAGTTRTNGKDFVWFSTPSGGWDHPRVWYTYIPTGSPRGTVMVVSFTTHSPEQREALARLVAYLQPSL